MVDHKLSPSEYQPGVSVAARSARTESSRKELVLGVVTWLSSEGVFIKICISIGNVYWRLIRPRQKSRRGKHRQKSHRFLSYIWLTRIDFFVE